MIHRYPRYGELFKAWEAQKHGGGWKGIFSTQDFRDLQVLSQLAWFDEEIQEHDVQPSADSYKKAATSLSTTRR